MTIYLKDRQTKEIIRLFNNVNYWGYNFVEFENNGKCKIYCDDTKYFTDKEVEENEYRKD